MFATAKDDSEPRFFFTAPWEPITVRRGDALGLRALADVFADAVAPDLSNRVQDGRWVTVLAWCLVRSQSVYHAAGGSHVMSRVHQQQRYAWLRPLELMWVARTIKLLYDSDDWRTRTLPGQRRVAPWILHDRKRPERFGLSADQFKAYRQTGLYGGYRVAFRRWDDMTLGGDGWTPGPATIALAKWLDGRLGHARPGWPLQPGDSADAVSTRSAKLGLGKETDWWLRQWRQFEEGGRSADSRTLPRPRSEYRVLPENELLTPLVFGDASNARRRRKIALAIEASRPSSHVDACDALADSFGDEPVMKYLPVFTRLADAGMRVMDLITDQVRQRGAVQTGEVASLPGAIEACGLLFQAAEAWRNASASSIRHIDAAHRFADVLTSTKPQSCLRALLHHHELHGGGQHWFVERDGRIEMRTPPRQFASRYRFRLWALCRLGAQCGLLRTLPKGLREGPVVVNEMEGEDE